jgi:hypothetical protein
LTALSPFGCGLNLSEKEWASGGDCFVGVLTSRHVSFNGTEQVAPSWTHAESGLTYEADKPIMAFIENGIKLEGIYANLDDNHTIPFDPLNLYEDFYISRKKIIDFREECSRYKSKKTIDSIIDGGKTIFSVVGIAVVLGFLFDN